MGRGRNIRSNDIRGRIQLVFQEPAESLNPRVRIGETIAEPLRYLGLSRADRDVRVREVVARLGLAESVLDQFPAELSAGQQQRVGIGRAIVTRPQLIVLDEPTSALDPTARAEIVDLLRRLQHELATAYLFISHDLSTVRFSAIGSRCSISGRLWKRLIPRICSPGRSILIRLVCSPPYCCQIPRSNSRAQSRLRAKSRAPSIYRPAARWQVAVRSRTRNAAERGPM